MANGRILIGKFLGQRRLNPDTSANQYAATGVPGKGKSFLDLDPDDLPPVNPGPQKVQFEPAPKLSKPTPAWGPIPVGDFLRTNPAGPQPSLPTYPSRPPAAPYLGPIPPALAAAGPQPSLTTYPSRPPAPPFVGSVPSPTIPAAGQPSLPTANSRPPAGPQVTFERGPLHSPGGVSHPNDLRLPTGIKYSTLKPRDIDPLGGPNGVPKPQLRAFGENPDYSKGPVVPVPELPGVVPSDPKVPPGPVLPTFIDGAGQRRPMAAADGGLGDPVQTQKTAEGWSRKAHSDRISANPNAILDPRSQGDIEKFSEVHPHAPEDATTSGRFTAQLQNVDDRMKNFLNNSGLGGSPFDLDKTGVPGTIYARPASGPGTQMLNPKLYAESLVRLGRAFGAQGGDSTVPNARALAAKLALFAADQVALHLLNRHGRFWNPLTIAPPPVAGAFLANTLDITTGTPPGLTGYIDSKPQGMVDSKPGFYEANHGYVDDPIGIGRDIHKTIANGNYSEVQVSAVPPFVNIIKNGGAAGPLNILNRLTPSLFGAPSEDTALVEDPATAIPTFAPLIPLALHERNAVAPDDDSKPATERLFSLDEIVDDMLDKGDSKFVKDDDLLKRKRFDVSSIFNRSMVKLGGEEWFPAGKLPYNPVGSNAFGALKPASKLQKAFYGSGIVPAAFSDDDLRDGFVVSEQGKNPTIDDDDAYVPMYFTDLRPISEKKFKTIYFRPFITNLTEDFSPSWNKKNYFGRVDPVAGYQSTDRTINLGFIVAAFSPEDLKVIYKKLNLLSALVYPEYDKDLLYKSGPVCRLRIGDLIAASPHAVTGLPGFIENLSIDYNEHVWELKKDNKVPMGYRVSLSFTVLHDVPIGVGLDGKFGGLGSIEDGKYQLPKSVNDANAKGPDVNGSSMFRNYGEVGLKEDV